MKRIPKPGSSHSGGHSHEGRVINWHRLARRLFVPLFLWLAFAGNLEAARSWFLFDQPPHEGKEPLTALATLIEGDNTWVGYANYGLVQYNYYGQILVTLTVKDGLPGPTVTDLAKRDKELWIGTSDGLAVRSEEGTLRLFTTKTGLPDNGITCLTVRDDTVYAGTMKGLVRFKGDSFDVLDENHGLPAGHVTALGVCDNGIMVGTPKGWGILRGGQIEPHTPQIDGLPFEWITAVSHYRYRRTALSDPQANTAEDYYVLGTAGGGLVYFRGGQYKVLAPGDDGPGAAWITSLIYVPEEKKLWVGTQEGLAICTIEDGTWERLTPQNSGLASPMIKDISVKVIDETVRDYEDQILIGKGRCPTGCAICSSRIAGRIAKPCPDCYKLPSPIKPRIYHKLQTWAAIGTDKGANLYYQKLLPHTKQGHFYSYLANQGYAITGIGAGETTFAGVYPPTLGKGFVQFFNLPKLVWEAGYSDPPSARFTMEINVLTATAEGYPMVGGYRTGVGGLAQLNLHQDKWQLWAGSEGLSDLNVTALYKEGTTMLIGTGGMGNSGSVFRLKEGKIESFPRTGLKKQGNSSMFDAAVTCLWGDGTKAFAGTRGDGLYSFDGSSWTRMETLQTKWLSDDHIKAIALHNEVLYIGTKKGLDVFGNGYVAHQDVTRFGAASNDVQALLWDTSEGDDEKTILWIGTRNGITRVSRMGGVMLEGVPHFQSENHPFPWPSSPPGLQPIWAYTWYGNPIEDMNDVCPYDGLPGNDITSLALDDLNLYIGTNNGICRIRK